MTENLRLRMRIRKMINKAAGDFFNSIEDEDLQNLTGEIMSLNEEWVLNNLHTYGAEVIMKHGLKQNQRKWIDNLRKKLKGGKN